MSTRIRRRLKRDILGLESIDGKPTAIVVPADAIIEELSEIPETNRIDILWNGKVLTMFVQDVRERGEEIRVEGQSHFASPAEE